MERKVSDYSNHSTRSTVHVPKLRIRATSQSTESGASLSLPDAGTFPSFNQSVTSFSQSLAPSEPFSASESRRSSIVTQTCDIPPTSGKGSKKRGFFSSLFSVKEPSIQALAQYEKQLKHAGTLKDGRLAAVGLTGVSSAKLPAHVPKTNSKWDGNPATSNKADKRNHQSSQEGLKPPSRESVGHRSLPSSSSDSLRPSMRRPASRATLSAASVYTTHSDGSRNQIAELYGWEVAEFSKDGDSASSSAGTRTASIRSTSTRPITNDDRDAITLPKIPDEYMPARPGSKPESPQMPAHSHSPALTPRDEMPLTPLGSSPLKLGGSMDSEKTLQGEQDAVTDETGRAPSDAPKRTEEVVLTTSGINVLSPPITPRMGAANTVGAARQGHSRANSTGPKSILKKESAYAADNETQQQSTLDSLFSQTAVLDYYHGPQWKRKMGVHTVRKGQRSPAATENAGDREGSPTPEGGIKMQRRKSIVGIFKT